MFDRGLLFGALFSAAFVSAQSINALLSMWIARVPIDDDVMLRPETPRAELVPLSAFLERNLFGARRSVELVQTSCPQVDLGARVVATIIGESAIAWIDRDGDLAPIRIGDRIADAEVIAIQRGALRLSRGGRCAELGIASLEGAPRPSRSPTLVRRVSAEELAIARADLEAAIEDPMRFAKDARIVPKTNQGFALFSIKPGGIVDQLGFENGDVLERINGIRLDDPKSWISPLELIERSEITVDYTRAGARRSLTLRIE